MGDHLIGLLSAIIRFVFGRMVNGIILPTGSDEMIGAKAVGLGYDGRG